MLIRLMANCLSTSDTTNRILGWGHRQEHQLKAFFCVKISASLQSFSHALWCSYRPSGKWHLPAMDLWTSCGPQQWRVGNLLPFREKADELQGVWCSVEGGQCRTLPWPLAGCYWGLGNVEGQGFESQVSMNGKRWWSGFSSSENK